MESAALVLFILGLGHASSLGVLFGWQPLPAGDTPEGRPQVEYIVQLEPELVAAMHAGQSIPITSDIPADIGPIGRIRIVVGRDELPRQGLATRFKPWPQPPAAGAPLPGTALAGTALAGTAVAGKQSGDGLLETQYRVEPVESSDADRYVNQAGSNGAILPPSDNRAAAANPFGRALQQGAQVARSLAADAQQQILPPADELFGDSSQGLQNAVEDRTNQLRQGFERGVQQAADQTGQRLGRAVDQAEQWTRETVSQQGRRPASSERSVLTTGQNQSSAAILPPNSPPLDQASDRQPNPQRQRIDQPVSERLQQRQPDGWLPGNSLPPGNFAANSSTLEANPSSQPGAATAPWPATTSNPPDETRASNSPPSRYGGQSIQPPVSAPSWPSGQSGRDAFQMANRDSENPPTRYADNRQPAYNQSSGNPGIDNATTGNTAIGNPASVGMQGPQFPRAGSQQPSPQNGDNHWTTQSSAPTITRDMLDQPSSDPRQAASNTQGYQPQTSARQPLGAQPRDLGWNQGNVDTRNQHGANSDDGQTLFPLLLSWVLLSGSGAGNAYLWWSYLDVRNKYHGVVHGLPGRRERGDN